MSYKDARFWHPIIRPTAEQTRRHSSRGGHGCYVFYETATSWSMASPPPGM